MYKQDLALNNLQWLISNPTKPISGYLSKTLYFDKVRIISKQTRTTLEELDSVLTKIKNRKAAGLDEIPPEVWKTRQFDDILL